MLIDLSMLTIILIGLATQGVFNKINGIIIELSIVYNMKFDHISSIASLPFGCNVEMYHS